MYKSGVSSCLADYHKKRSEEFSGEYRTRNQLPNLQNVVSLLHSQKFKYLERLRQDKSRIYGTGFYGNLPLKISGLGTTCKTIQADQRNLKGPAEAVRHAQTEPPGGGLSEGIVRRKVLAPVCRPVRSQQKRRLANRLGDKPTGDAPKVTPRVTFSLGDYPDTRCRHQLPRLKSSTSTRTNTDSYCSSQSESSKKLKSSKQFKQPSIITAIHKQRQQQRHLEYTEFVDTQLVRGYHVTRPRILPSISDQPNHRELPLPSRPKVGTLTTVTPCGSIGHPENIRADVVDYDQMVTHNVMSFLAVPIVNPRRIRTLNPSIDGATCGLHYDIPEIRMIAATPLPPIMVDE